jgi:pimeloyl-ACP methyl ester carboxylesterase
VCYIEYKRSDYGTLVLIICAEKDKTTPKLVNQKMHEKILNSKLIVIEKAAHQSILEKAPEINKHIMTF